MSSSCVSSLAPKLNMADCNEVVLIPFSSIAKRIMEEGKCGHADAYSVAKVRETRKRDTR